MLNDTHSKTVYNVYIGLKLHMPLSYQLTM